MDFVRRGGKKNRKNQVIMIQNFLSFTDSVEKFASVYRLGNRHVINFWKAHRDFSEKVAYEYWLALCHLWEWIGKTEKPPAARIFRKEPQDNDHDSLQENHDDEADLFKDGRDVIKYAMRKNNISVQRLANMTGCDLIGIQVFIDGSDVIDFAEFSEILIALSISFLYRNSDGNGI